MSRKIVKVQSKFKRFVSVDDQDKLQQNDVLASGTKNVRTEAIGSVRPRYGTSVVHTSNLISNPLGMSIYTDTNGVAAAITSDGKNVWATRTNTVKVGEFSSQGTVFRSQMAGNSLYSVNASSLPYRLKSANGLWRFGPIGMSTPSAPTQVTGAAAAISDLANPSTTPIALGMYDLPNGSGYVYAALNDHTVIKYNVATNAWETVPEPAENLDTPWGVSTFPTVGIRQTQGLVRWSDGTLMWFPSAVDSTNANNHSTRAWSFDPSADTWTGPYTLFGSAAYHIGPWANPVQTGKYWSEERNLVYIGQFHPNLTSYDLTLLSLVKDVNPDTNARIMKLKNVNSTKLVQRYNPVPSNITVATGNAFAIPINKSTFSRDYIAFAFWSNSADTTATVYVSWMDFSDSGLPTRLMGTNELSGETLVMGDSMYYNGSDRVYIVKAGTNKIWMGLIEKLGPSFKVTWSDVTQLGAGITRNAPIVGGHPNFRSFFYFRTGNDFVSENEPVDSQSQSGDTISLAITAVDSSGNESNISNSITVANVLAGGSVSISLPSVSKTVTETNETSGAQTTTNDVSTIYVYRTTRNDPTGKKYFDREITGAGGSTVSFPIIDANLDLEQEAPTDNTLPEAGQEFFTFYGGRVNYAKGSRIRSSKSDAFEAFPDEYVTELNPDDGDVITSMLRGNNLNVAKERSLFSASGDLVDNVIRQVMFSDGNIDSRISAEMDVGTLIYTRKGMAFFDGYLPKPIDGDVEDLSDALHSQDVVHTSITDEGVGIFYRATGAATTNVLLYDMTRGHWVYDVLPYALSGVALLNSSTGAITEGLIAVSATGQFVRLYDPAYTTDNGADIDSAIVFRPFMSPDEYHEANWDAVTLDFQATGTYNITGTLQVDEGATVYTIDAIAGDQTGRVEKTVRLPVEAVGRTGTFRFALPRNATTNGLLITRVFTTLKLRERIPL